MASPAPFITSSTLRRLLPHAYPMLLVDRVLEVAPGKSGRGIKNVSFNEQVLQGHFPGAPIFPGCLLLEACAQMGAIVLLAGHLDQHESGELTIPVGAVSPVQYLASVERFKFRKRSCPATGSFWKRGPARPVVASPPFPCAPTSTTGWRRRGRWWSPSRIAERRCIPYLRNKFPIKALRLIAFGKDDRAGSQNTNLLTHVMLGRPSANPIRRFVPPEILVDLASVLSPHQVFHWPHAKFHCSNLMAGEA